MVSRSGDDPAWQDNLEGSSAGCNLLNFAHKARDWWLETTDVVFLNSPWLRRSTGRGFRCLWILFHVFLWCIGGFPILWFDFVEDYPVLPQILERLCFILMFLAFAKVFGSSIMTSRDTLSNGFLLVASSMMSFAFWAEWETTPDLWVPGQNAFITAFLGYTFPVLCHCNVHPVVLPLLLAHTLGYTYNHFQDTEGSVSDLLLLFHIVGFQFCMCFAFSLDFTKRVKAVATGMLHNADTYDPLESPVAGRSARGFCWLAAIINWVFMASFCFLSSIPGGGSRYPSWMYILDTICLCLPWMPLLCTRSPNCTPFKSDLVFVIFSFAPPAWILLRHALDPEWNADVAFDIYYRLSWFLGGTSTACTSTVFATQAAIQAGCIPLLCLMGVLFVTIIFVAMTSLHCEFCWKMVFNCGYEIPMVVSLAARLHRGT